VEEEGSNVEVVSRPGILGSEEALEKIISRLPPPPPPPPKMT